MPVRPRSQGERPYPQLDLTGGLANSLNEFVIDDSQTPDCLNIDFDRSSCATSRGSVKFNNQTAPRSAIRTRTSSSPLYFKQGFSVPLRGYGYLPYDPDHDRGGTFAYEGDFLLGTETFHNARGRTFEVDVSFELPIEERLYERQSRGANAPAIGAESAGSNPPHGFDEGLDEAICIIQKGGDRTAPMSWALAIVNIGDGTGLASAPAQRPSNYALCFMWLDAPQWGESSPSLMRYSVASGVNPAVGTYSTQAYRSILLHQYIEPGKKYHVAFQVRLDSGSCGSSGVNTAWNDDGLIYCALKDETGAYSFSSFVDSGGGGTATDLEVHRGPDDSLQYLARYGIRYSGRDAMFLGLGMRSFAWKKTGFIPYGSDCTAIDFGGFQMVDHSAVSTATLYGGAMTLTFAHTVGDAYVVANYQGLSLTDDEGGLSPFAVGGPGVGGYSYWTGFTNGGTLFNPDALRHYKLVAPSNFAVAAMRGGICEIQSYSEAGASYRLNIRSGGTAANFGTWAASPMFIQCYRWHQRELVIGEVRLWNVARDYSSATANARARWSIGHGLELDDTSEPDVENLCAYWPCDDSEGGLLRELVKGGTRNGHLLPFSLSTTNGGVEGETMVMLSGEGEAPCIDLSENPVFRREVGEMLAGTSQGFALELSCVFTEAFYAIQDNTVVLPDRKTTGATVTGSRPLFVPEVMSWDVKDAATSGMASAPKPILALTFRGALASTNSVPFRFPAAFAVEVAHASDNQGIDPVVPSDLQPWLVNGGGANVARYGLDAPWVGKRVTIQIGIQSTGVTDEYDVYIAMTPKDAFNPASGDPSGAEFAYWTAGGGSYSAANADYFTAAHLTIRRKDLVRSIITLGRWNCGTLGYAELQPRMLVDKLRVFATSAPGALPTANGGVLTLRNGKLEGESVLPQRLLQTEDILQELGPELFAADVTDGSAIVTAGSGLRFYTAEPRTALHAVKGTYLFIGAEKRVVLQENTFSLAQDQFYLVASQAADGSTLTLAHPYQDATRKAAWCASLRLMGYTAFEDDIRDKTLSLGTGKAFTPGTTTVADVVLSDVFWQNGAPLTNHWRLRIYSPLGRTPISEITPYWTAGLVSPRHNPILGIYGFNAKTYCAVRGSVYEADDRWRQIGPTKEVERALTFRGRIAEGLSVPLAQDRLEMSTAVAYAPAADDSKTWNFEGWVNLDTIEEYQTVFWIGNRSSDPALAAVTSHGFHLGMRFYRGRPQLVIGSTAVALTLGTIPEKGLYVASGASPIPAGEWVHVRFSLPTRTQAGTQVLLIPSLQVNGRSMAVTVNARENNAAIVQSYDWIRKSTLGSQSNLRTVIGAWRDSFRVPSPSQAFTGTAVGTNVNPNRVHGWVHSLGGQLAAVRIFDEDVWTNGTAGALAPNFDPFAIDYSPVPRLGVLVAPEAFGHLVLNQADAAYGTIYSHPFIGLFHELGYGDEPASWAEFGNDLFVTTGAKPARIMANATTFAGVPAPTTELDFTFEKFPIWKPNVRSSNQGTTVNENAENDPIDQAVAAATQQIDHYDTHGNTYLIAALGATAQAVMQWKRQIVAPAARMIAFKGYIKPRDISGRQVIFAQRPTDDSGGFFVEMRDGALYMGWYDAYLKRTVTIKTTSQVFRVGHWHYVYVRKEIPQQEDWQGNWVNSFFTHGYVRRVGVTTGGAGTIGRTQLSFVGSGATGQIFYADIPGGIGSYVSNKPTFIEYLRVSGEGLVGDADVQWAGDTGTNDPVAPTRPMHDSAVVRFFPKTLAEYTDPTKTHPLMARVGRICQFTISAGAGFAAGATLTDNVGKIYKVLWAHPLAAPTAGQQTCCIYAYNTTSYAITFGGANLTDGAGTTATGFNAITLEDSVASAAAIPYSNCISFVHDALTIPGAGGSGYVTQPFQGTIFDGLANGRVLIDPAGIPFSGPARCFHPDMVGMYWIFSTTGGGTLAGKAYKIVSVSFNLAEIRVVDPSTGTAPDLSAINNAYGGVYMGVALSKDSSFDLSKEPDGSLQTPRFFGHGDAANVFSGIAPFNGEYDSFGMTMVTLNPDPAATDDYRPFDNRDTSIGGVATLDPIVSGTDRFGAPIFAGSIPLGRLHFDPWTVVAGPPITWSGTFDCVDGQDYAGNPVTVASSQPTYDLPAGEWTITPAATPAMGTSDKWKFQFLQDRSIINGSSRYFRAAFYDIDQDAVSAPGPALLVKADDDDLLNPSGQVRYTITNLGSPRRRGRFEVWLYMGLAGGDASTLFRVARVPVGAAEVAIAAAETGIATFAPLSLLAGEAPRCALVASSAGRMFYGALESDPSFAAFSEAGLPVSIDFAAPSLFTLGGGAGERITLLSEIDGNLVAGKRNAIARVDIGVESGAASVLMISKGIGCSAPASAASIDGRLYLLSDGGISMLTRAGVTNLAMPLNTSGNVIDLFADEMDRAEDLRYVACIYRPRNQYILLYRGVDEAEMDRRLSIEMHDEPKDALRRQSVSDAHCYSKYQGPRLTAIASVRSLSGGREQLIGGTKDGFLLFMDRDDTQLHLMGATTEVWGTPSGTASASAQSTRFIDLAFALTGGTALEGIRGTPVHFVDTNGAEYTVEGLFQDSQKVYFDREADAVPAINSFFTIGQQQHLWETRWLDMQNPQYLKNLSYLDFLYRLEGSGSMRMEVFMDMDETVRGADNNVDLSIAPKEYPVGNCEGYRFKLRLSSVRTLPAVKWDLSGIMWRVKDQDQD